MGDLRGTMTDDERAIRELIATWMTASQAGDIERAARRAMIGVAAWLCRKAEASTMPAAR